MKRTVIISFVIMLMLQNPSKDCGAFELMTL